MVGQDGSGREVQILRVKDHCIELDEKALGKILLSDRIKDKHVAVISLAGTFRKGKSFMLSFFLRFLYKLGSSAWLGDSSEPLRGFTWCGGCNRYTTGILIWKDVFLVKIKKDEEIAVLLMDTQGTYDDKSTVKESASIFALATLLSSVLVYNISENIQEDHLQYLQLFTDYGRLVQQQMSGKPFQKLLFLVRDWYYSSDAEYGAIGGSKLLQERLKLDKKHKQLQQLRKHIHSCFNEIDCFLMPHPGLKVAQEKSFDGRLSDIEKDFKEQLLHLVPSILAPEKLIPKEINGRKVTCQQLFIYMMTYVHKFKGDELPEPKTAFEATAEGNHFTALHIAMQQYTTTMVKLCGGRKVSWKKLNRIHSEACTRAMDTFHNTPKMGDEELSRSYQQKLSQGIARWYACFASGMTKTCILETKSCRVAEGASTTALAIGAAVCFGVGLPIHGACCGVAAVVIASVFLGSLVYGCCLSDCSTDTHAIGGKADKAPSKEVPCKGQHFPNDTLDIDFLRQCLNETPKANEMKNKLETIGRAKDKYLIRMEEICREDTPFLKPDTLLDLHCRHRQTALTALAEALKTAGMEPPQGTLDALAQEIDEAFENFSNQNASKMSLGSRALAKLRAKFKKSSTPCCRLKQS